ncbi:MAG: hypothetical protein B5M52_01835 [Helicobacteraceae bacterium 4484_230]|nr:MAG: hypothetical protein B5M52_01835 [Helicobacteraceae bacterium 4484_230]
MEELKKKILKAQEAGDIAALYVLEGEAHEMFDEQTLSAYYANILDLALENLTNALESARQFDMNSVQDFATVRALYEYAVEHYSAGKLSDAAALFEILSGLTNDEAFASAMKIHMRSAQKGVSLDDFINKTADVDATQKAGTFYISVFKEGAA